MSQPPGTSEKRIEEIKKELAKVLAKKALDFARISELATELSGLDTETAAFSVNATIIRRIGRELVAAHETALAELVKNAYDADATQAKVIFSRTDRRGGRLVIEDDGVGMTPQQVRDGFLRIASQQKVEEPRSTKYLRQRAGQKGIGRFAVERLGDRLHLITATELDNVATELIVDWSDFEKAAELASIRSPIKRTAKTFPHGTRLVIGGLRESWSIESIQTAGSYVSDLTEPKYLDAFLPADGTTRSSRKDPGFSAIFSVLDGVLPKAVAGAEVEAVHSALAFVDATVDDSGNWKLRIVADQWKLDRKYKIRDVARDEQHDWKFESLRGVRLRAAYFVFEDETEFPDGLNRRRLRKLLKARGGIKLYRNGFRVAPYGAPDDDWLGLDRAETKRSLLVPIKNINWVGFVSVDDPEHERTVETSSREGLVANRFLEELTKFARNSLMWAAADVGKARGKKVYAGDRARDFGQAKSERALRAAQTIAKYLEELEKTRKGGTSSYSKDAITDATLAEVRVELEKMVKDAGELVGEIGILRVFASVGMSVLMFSHEVKGLIAGMGGQVDGLLENDEVPAKTKRHLREFQTALGRLQHLTNFYESTGSAAADRTLSGVDVFSMVNSFVRSFEPQAKKRGIDLRFEGDEMLPVRNVAMHEAEFNAVLINLYTNAVKAIGRHRNPRRTEILMRHSRAGNVDIVDVLDTGVGIKAADKDKIFQPFFTTTPIKRALRPGDPEMFGTGLGLTISRDAIRAARGTMEVVFPPPDDYAACIRIELPQIPHEQT